MLTQEQEVPGGLILRSSATSQIWADSFSFPPCCSQSSAHSASIANHSRSGNTLLRLRSDTMTPPGVTWHIQSPGCLKDTWFFLWQCGYPKPPKTWLQRRESQPLASVHTRSSQVTWIWVRRESCPSGAERITAYLTIRIHRAMVFNPGLGIRVTWRALKTQMFRAVLDPLRTSGVAPGNT